MSEFAKAEHKIKSSGKADNDYCDAQYALQGPQVEPEASYWLECEEHKGCTVPRPPTLAELSTKFPGSGTPGIPSFPPFPTDKATLQGEIQELIILSRQRDEPVAIQNDPP